MVRKERQPYFRLPKKLGSLIVEKRGLTAQKVAKELQDEAFPFRPLTDIGDLNDYGDHTDIIRSESGRRQLVYASLDTVR